MTIRIILGNIFIGIGVFIYSMSMQMKNKKNILIGLILVNVASIISYIIIEKYSAVGVHIVAILQTYIKYLYDLKEKIIPKKIQWLFIILSIAFGSVSIKNIFDILPMFCTVFYTLSILQSKEKNIRLLCFFNILGWVIYDFYAKLYVGTISNMFTLTSDAIAIYRYDIKGKSKIHEQNGADNMANT